MNANKRESSPNEDSAPSIRKSNTKQQKVVKRSEHEQKHHDNVTQVAKPYTLGIKGGAVFYAEVKKTIGI